MDFLLQAFAFIFSPENFGGSDGVAARSLEHLGYTVLTLALACVVGIPLGLYIGHTGKLRGLAVGAVGALRALPTLGLLLLLALGMPLGAGPAIVALVILALPPVLAGAYSGVEDVSRETIDAARALGFTSWQILLRVELPLSLPILVGGVRSAALQVIATWTVAGILPVGGLGRYIFDALPLQQYPKMLAGSLLVIILALIVEAIFASIQAAITPRGVRVLRTVNTERS